MNSQKQAEARQRLYRLLGDLPPRDRPIAATLRETSGHDGYILESLLLDLNGLEPVPAYFVGPREVSGPSPCILYHHCHGNDYALGKKEMIVGRDLLCSPPYAEALTSQGWSALCIDAWAFGERGGRTESALFKEMLWSGQVLWGMMVYDSLRALDYLVSRPDVDAQRISTLGLSMGSTMAWWIAALDPRVKVCVDICCLTDFQALIASGGLDEHGVYYYVPSLLKHFTASQINALIAPRPHLSLAGNLDPLTPPAGLDRIDNDLRLAYTALGAQEAWQIRRYDAGHIESPAMRTEILGFLKRWL